MSAIDRALQKLQTGLRKQEQEFGLDEVRLDINRQLRRVALTEAVTQINADQGSVVDLDEGTGFLVEKQAEIANESGLIGPAISGIATGKQDVPQSLGTPEATEKLNLALSKARAAGLAEEAEGVAAGEAAVGFLSRTLQIIDSLGAFVRGTILEGEDSDNILEEIGQRLASGAENAAKALKGEETKTFTRRFEGAAPTAGGFGLDVLTDPLTYLTFGATGVAKATGAGIVRSVAREAADEGVEKAARTLAKKVFETAQPKGGRKAARKIADRAATGFHKIAKDVDPEDFRQLADRLTQEGARGLREVTEPRALQAFPGLIRPGGVRARVPFAERLSRVTGRSGVKGLTTGRAQPLKRLGQEALDRVPGGQALRDFFGRRFDFWHDVRKALNNEELESFIGAFRRSVGRGNHLRNLADQHLSNLQAAVKEGLTGSEIERLGAEGVAARFGPEAGEAVDYFQNTLADAAEEVGISFGRLDKHFPHVIEDPNIRRAIKEIKKGSGGRVTEGNLGATFSTEHAQRRKLEGFVDDINEWSRDELGADIFTENPIIAYRLFSHSVNRAISRRQMLNELVESGVARKVPKPQEVAERIPNPQNLAPQALRQARVKGIATDLRDTLASGRSREGLLRIPERAQGLRDELENLKSGAILGGGGREAKHYIEDVQDVLGKLEEGWEIAKGTSGEVGIPEGIRMFFQNTIDHLENPGPLLRGYDKVLDYWKSVAIATSGFVGRNYLGIQWQNTVIAGIPITEQFSAIRELVGEADNIIDYAKRGVLEDIQHPIVRRAYESGLVKTGQIRAEKFGFRSGLKRKFPTINTPKGTVVLNPLDRDFVLWRLFHKPQQAAEDFGRYTVFRHAVKRGATDEEALDLAGQLHFFYNELTPFEKRWAKRFAPFYCADQETEILTDEGWKTHEQLQVGDVALTLNRETGESEWQEVQEVFSKPHDGELVKLSSDDGFDALVTEDHKWPVLNEDGTYRLVETQDLRDGDEIPLTEGYTTSGLKQERVPHSGVVWCPNLPNGTFYARRGKSTYFTGNTFFKNNLKLQLEGIFSQPGKYKRLLDAQRLGEDLAGIEVSDLPISERVRENLPIPIPGKPFGFALFSQDLPTEELAQLPIPTEVIESLVKLDVQELTRQLGFRDQLAPFVELGANVFAGEDAIGRGLGEAVPAPTWAQTPGMRDLLTRIGAMEDTAEGPVIPVGVQFAVEGLHPGLYRVRLFTPQTEEGELKQAQRTVSTLFGVGVRRRSRNEEARELERRAREINRLTSERKRKRALEAGTRRVTEELEE